MLLEPVGEPARFFTKSLEQHVRVMPGREELRPLGVDHAIADADIVGGIHQLADEVKSKAGAAKSGDPLPRRENDAGVLQRVLKVVFADHEPRTIRAHIPGASEYPDFPGRAPDLRKPAAGRA